MTEPEPALPRETIVPALGFCLAAGALLRFGLLWCLDLRGAFGPDAPGAAAAALTGPLRHPYPLHPALIRLFSVPVGDPVQGALLLSLSAGLATVGAAWLLGRVMTSGRDGRAMGLMAAASPLLVHVSLLRGGDALAIALAWWGVALAWWGARAQASTFEPARGARAAMVCGGLLWGLSAAAKPVGLPAGAFLVLAFGLGDRRCWPWLGAGLLAGGGLALPFLRPFLQPRPELGLLGSWWHPGVPSPVALPGWALAGAFGVLRAAWNEPWVQLVPFAALAAAGAVVVGPRRPFRVALFAVACAAPTLLVAMLGSRLAPRYLAGSTLGWVLLSGMALTPRGLRAPGLSPGGPLRAALGPLPLSIVLTLLAMSALRHWQSLGELRAREEGTARPRGVLADLTEDRLPEAQFRDSSVCGALELERLAATLATRAPRGGTVAALPLRDGRTWHLFGPLAAARPDLALREIGPACCPAGPAACAAAIPGALAAAGGGALVVPRLPEGRCATGALRDGGEAWQAALAPLLPAGGAWYGALEVAAGHGPAELCAALGGRPPEAPARP